MIDQPTLRCPLIYQIFKQTTIRKIKIQMDAIINPQKGIKTFVFEKEQTQQSLIIDYQIDLRQSYININYLLSVYCPLQHHKVSIYDPNQNKFVALRKIGGQNGFIAKTYLQPKIILIRYKRILDYLPQSDSLESSLEQESRPDKKDGRSKQRTIAEVIELVKRWRNLHLHGHKSIARRMNLQQAAKLVGISKKSLDDYYCQLRLGEFYNFDFAGQLQQKMGVLRSFVKDYRPEKDQKRKHQKHPKNLKIIQQFQIQTRSLRIPIEQQPIALQMKHRQSHTQNLMQQKYEQIPHDEPLSRQLFNLEHEFFKGFEFALQQPSDPYFQIDRDFRKKDFQQDSNSFLYF